MCRHAATYCCGVPRCRRAFWSASWSNVTKTGLPNFLKFRACWSIEESYLPAAMSAYRAEPLPQFFAAKL